MDCNNPTINKTIFHDFIVQQCPTNLSTLRPYVSFPPVGRRRPTAASQASLEAGTENLTPTYTADGSHEGEVTLVCTCPSAETGFGFGADG